MCPSDPTYHPLPPSWMKTSLPASRHITTGHWLNWFEVLPYVYPIIFPCHDRKSGLPCSVQFNFSMGPRWWKLCGLGFRSVTELRCTVWLVIHEGGSFSEWEGGGGFYDGNPVIMGIWADSYSTGALLNLVTPRFRLWPFFFVFIGWRLFLIWCPERVQHTENKCKRRKHLHHASSLEE